MYRLKINFPYGEREDDEFNSAFGIDNQLGTDCFMPTMTREIDYILSWSEKKIRNTCRKLNVKISILEFYHEDCEVN